ncbi:protein CcmA, bactofilin family [Arboricoccus pini]|uniref:Protein CcmA, bactofilin family n=1 Tax=Arboricoccus pini TaxID=1963835 RepID=A0A212Q2J7_9PROT|nr:polymer-forming cytoskeletal protein [Arboricoccus pini]SNB53474.1 protein CcmA, bactofilin family [Arboricoccus pini]
MFRRKENEPARPAGSETKVDSTIGRPALDVKSQPELPRRQVDLPTAPSAFAEKAEPKSDPAETKKLIVGPGISLAGEITACDRLIVQGSVQVTLNQTKAIEISEEGRFTNGKAEVEEADISGLYEGELTVRKRLIIRSSGQVKGTVRYGEIEIETGGKLSGSVSMLTDKAS